MRATGSGMTVLSLRLAFNDRRKNAEGQWDESPNYIDVTMFGKGADAVSRFLQKGKQIAVDGKLRWSEWDDRNSGDKRSKIEIIADDIELLGGRGDEANAHGGGANDGPTRASAPSAAPSIDDEDIPF